MIRLVSFITTVFLLSSCNNKHVQRSEISVELYICPRVYSCNMYIDKGIFNYRLEKKSVVETRENSCFVNALSSPNHKMSDSVITMFYKKIDLDEDLYNKCFPGDTIPNDFANQAAPRALLIIHKGNKADTLQIYKEKIWRNNQQYHPINAALDSIFICSLPLDLKDNWR